MNNEKKCRRAPSASAIMEALGTAAVGAAFWGMFLAAYLRAEGVL